MSHHFGSLLGVIELIILCVHSKDLWQPLTLNYVRLSQLKVEKLKLRMTIMEH